jgi:hypothetical protein
MKCDAHSKWGLALPPTPTVPATAAAGSRGGSRWVGRVAAEASLVPFPGRRPPRLRAESAFRGLAPDLSAWPRSLRWPADAGAHPVSGGSSRGPKPPSRFLGSSIGANPSAFAIGFRSKRTPIIHLAASDRSKLRPSAFRYPTEASSDLPPRTSKRRTSSPPASAFPSEQAPPVPPAGSFTRRTPHRFRFGSRPKQAPVPILHLRFRGAIPASVRAVAAP